MSLKNSLAIFLSILPTIVGICGPAASLQEDFELSPNVVRLAFTDTPPKMLQCDLEVLGNMLSVYQVLEIFKKDSANINVGDQIPIAWTTDVPGYYQIPTEKFNDTEGFLAFLSGLQFCLAEDGVSEIEYPDDDAYIMSECIANNQPWSTVTEDGKAFLLAATSGGASPPAPSSAPVIGWPSTAPNVPSPNVDSTTAPVSSPAPMSSPGVSPNSDVPTLLEASILPLPTSLAPSPVSMTSPTFSANPESESSASRRHCFMWSVYFCAVLSAVAVVY
jgi:hypothetical protein